MLIWNGPPADGSAAPTWVLGQKDFTTATSNRGRLAGALVGDELAGPTGVLVADGVVYVTDTTNNRVLGWRSVPSSDGAPAAVILGQPNPDTGYLLPNNGALNGQR